MKLKEFLDEIEIKYSNWNDYGFYQTAEIIMPETKKSFFVHIYPNEEDGITYRKIKENRQIEKVYLYCKDQEYYEQINKLLVNPSDRERWYELTGDLAYSGTKFIEDYDELVKKFNQLAIVDNENDLYLELKNDKFLFEQSFFRDTHENEWKGSIKQLHRLTIGKDYLSDYSFDINNKVGKLFSVNVKQKDNIMVNEENGILPFSVSKNVHAIIGDNGSGKTTFIKSLVKAFLYKSDDETGINIIERQDDIKEDVNKIDKILYVSFSPFDSQIVLNEGEKRLRYIGIHESSKDENLSEYMVRSILESLEKLRNSKEERVLWFQLMNRINSERWVRDVCKIMEDKFTCSKVMKDDKEADYWIYIHKEDVSEDIKKLSSGQKILVLSLTKIVLEMTERTVVFFDEPELFLHPPLIKAYIRLIADLTSKYNGLTFIVTHSPITIQEIPHDCVKIATRNIVGEYEINDIAIRTFGESISTINEKIFGVGLLQTGFYNLIELMKNTGELEDNIYKLDQIVGSEGKVLMKYLSENTK